MIETGCSPETVASAAWFVCLSEQTKFKDVLKRLIGVDFYVPSELDGDISCFYCNAYLSGGENHEDDCPYIEAKKALGILKI